REEGRRTPYSLVTFGSGPRVCIGMSFAHIEIAAMAMHILRAYTLAPLEGQEIVHRCDGIIAALPYGLPVCVTAR
ncbi:MAG TPA: cytochrome P450, partial [Chloroflexota bacterium]|nr:cytochrome P450 [Chloroflexota bacterium]